MTSYIAAIRAEWLAAGWRWDEWERAIVLPGREVTIGDAIDAYCPATLLNSRD
jgi:hypothetical protein